MNPQTANAIKVVTAVTIKALPKIIATRRAIKATKAERKFYEEVIAANSIDTPSEPIRVECERLA